MKLSYAVVIEQTQARPKRTLRCHTPSAIVTFNGRRGVHRLRRAT